MRLARVDGGYGRAKVPACSIGRVLRMEVSSNIRKALGKEPDMPRIVPVLDLSRLEQGASERRTFLADLRSASRDIGFFYLAGHGISGFCLWMRH